MGMKSWFACYIACCAAPAALFMPGMKFQPNSPHPLFGLLRHREGIQPASSLLTKQPKLRHSRPEPTSVYQKQSIHGFTVLINPVVRTQPQASRAMQAELTAQLAAISQVMPTKPLSALRKVWIWVEWDNREGAAEFHPSVEWLRQHGYNPDKAGCVEISNTRNFVQWSRSNQPWMMLHELAHAYHHRVLGDANAEVQQAYHHALNQGLYQSVSYSKGPAQKAYALTNAKEYFAELSESYFGKNDFYPFNRTQLKTYDLRGYQLMEKSWGKPSR